MKAMYKFTATYKNNQYHESKIVIFENYDFKVVMEYLNDYLRNYVVCIPKGCFLSIESNEEIIFKVQ